MYAEDKRVIVSVDSNPMYLFFMPLTAIIWKKFAKYTPVIFIVGDEKDFNETPIKKLSLDLTKTITDNIHFIKPLPGYNDGNLAQLSRLYGGCLDLPDKTYLLTSDMDMWPLSTTFFHQHNWHKELHLYYANAYNHEKYPICYCGAKVDTWRKIMKVNQGSIHDELKKQIDAGIGYGANADSMWNYDELLLGLRIKEWSGYKESCQFIDRRPEKHGLPNGRVDRYCWEFDNFHHKLIDSHVLRPLWPSDNWDKVVPLLKCLINTVDFQSMQEYRDNYLKLM